MINENRITAFDSWIELLRNKLIELHPHLIDIFEIYSIEAKYGRLYIDADLSKLSPGSEVLEVGAGCMLLSCQLKREGYDVTAL